MASAPSTATWPARCISHRGTAPRRSAVHRPDRPPCMLPRAAWAVPSTASEVRSALVVLRGSSMTLVRCQVRERMKRRGSSESRARASARPSPPSVLARPIGSTSARSSSATCTRARLAQATTVIFRPARTRTRSPTALARSQARAVARRRPGGLERRLASLWGLMRQVPRARAPTRSSHRRGQLECGWRHRAVGRRVTDCTSWQAAVLYSLGRRYWCAGSMPNVKRGCGSEDGG
mmetsp:Transcript_7417/g.19462  ORF Transcript_7417/g.19462 Transcript_7417/m.19462 type:complete len:235 (+) Transcript_7417:418-1122(+)